MATHLAAMSPAKGQPLELQARPTPKPGPGELLVLVKSVALNPADGLMRNLGLFTPNYPTVIGFDMAGLVLEVGEGVPTSVGDAGDDTPGLFFQPGEKCLVPWQHAVPLPDENMSWNEAATLPVATVVALNAWETLGFTVPVPKPGTSTTQPSDKTTHGGAQGQNKKTPEAVLIWGASSSVGTMGAQAARLMREDRDSPVAAVYATSGPANTAYISALGADRVFDYKDPGVVDAIVAAAREDGLCSRRFLVMAKGEGGEQKETAMIGSAPPLPPDADVVDGVEAVFLLPSSEEEVRLEQFRFWMGTWLREGLGMGLIKPSPEPRVVGKGLGVINAGLDMVLQGVSCTKLVVEIGE
ncbi:chaperonin 10-like protein [Apiospora rasikravindrae]|uniref:Chaperonin 10-like protein n=1 Tax=Apiospora rasikravindrae TaxID=990691 RepID=A0ABR1SIR1_9PEZI